MNVVEQTSKEPKKWRKYVLISSLALNALIICLFLGAMVAGSKFKHGYSSHGSPRVYIRSLTSEQRDVFRSLRRVEMKKSSIGKSELEAASTAVKSAILADPFSKQGLSDALIGQQKAGSGYINAFRNGFAETIDAMSNEERVAYVTRIEENLKKRKRGKHKY